MDTQSGGVTFGQQNTISITGDVVSGNKYVGYTADEVSVLLTQISTTFQPKPFDGRCPYVGLAAFDEQDADRFFGRERLVNELLARVKESRFVVIAGPSGSGKSSLVRAGLIHKLKQGALPGSERWLYESLKPGRNALDELARVTSSLASTLNAGEDIRTKGKSDPKILHQWAEIALKDDRNRRAIILIDQFEELFTQVTNESERLAFLNLLTQAVTVENGRVTVLFTLRSDFVSNCATYPQLNALLNQQFMQVGAMQRDELVSAIALPALHVGLRIDPDLIAQIVNDMGDEPGALPLMQFALKDVFDTQQAQGSVIALTLISYLARGGIRKALERHADEAFADLSEVEQQLAREVFKRLIQLGRGTQDTRRTALFDELVPTGSNKANVETVVQKLASARLITTDERADKKDTVTISHERLIEAWPWLQKLVNENREIIALENQISEDAEIWEVSQHDASYLYVGARLQTAQEQLTANKITLNALAQAFVDAGVREQSERERLAKERQQRELEQARTLAEEQQKRAEEEQLRAEAERQRAAEQQRRAEAEQQRANTEQKRAEEQAQAAKTLRRRAIYLGAALLLAVVLAILVGIAQQKAASSAKSEAIARQASETSEAIAVTRESEAQVAATAESQQHQIAENEKANAQRQVSGQLAARALGFLNTRTDLSLLLSVEANQITKTVEAKGSLLAALTHDPRLAKFLNGQTGPVQSLALSSDGLLASAGNRNGTVILWNIKSPDSLERKLADAKQPVLSLAFSHNGKTLAAGDLEGNVILWDVNNGYRSRTIPNANAQKVLSVAFSADDQVIATGSCGQLDKATQRCNEGKISLWNLTNGQIITQPLTSPIDWVYSLAFHPQRPILASASCAEFAEGNQERTCKKGEIRLWDTANARPLMPPLTGHTDVIRSLAFSPDGMNLASGSADGSIILWDLTGTEPISTMLSGKHTGWVYDVEFSSDSKQLVSSSCGEFTEGIQGRTCTRGEIYLWDVRSRQRLDTLTAHSSFVSSIAFNGSMLASGSFDASVILWNMTGSGSLGHPLIGHNDIVRSVAFHPNNQVLASGSCGAVADGSCKQGEIRLWNVRESQELRPPLVSHKGIVSSVDFSLDGMMLASGSEDGSIVLWNTNTWAPLAQLPIEQPDGVTSVAFSPDGKMLASGGLDQSVILWDIETHKLLYRLPDENIVTSVAFSPDGKILADGNGDGAIMLWEVVHGQLLKRLETGTPSPVKHITFSADGQWLASSDFSSTPFLWNVATKEKQRLVSLSPQPMPSLAFSPDSQTLAAGTIDGHIVLWDVNSRLPIGLPVTAHWPDGVTDVVFSRDGQWLASSGNDKIVMLWNIDLKEWIKRACQIANRNLEEPEWKQYFGVQEYRKICQDIP